LATVWLPGEALWTDESIKKSETETAVGVGSLSRRQGRKPRATPIPCARFDTAEGGARVPGLAPRLAGPLPWAAAALFGVAGYRRAESSFLAYTGFAGHRRGHSQERYYWLMQFVRGPSCVQFVITGRM
jgi:hypothetical protein